MEQRRTWWLAAIRRVKDTARWTPRYAEQPCATIHPLITYSEVKSWNKWTLKSIYYNISVKQEIHPINQRTARKGMCSTSQTGGKGHFQPLVQRGNKQHVQPANCCIDNKEIPNPRGQGVIKSITARKISDVVRTCEIHKPTSWKHIRGAFWYLFRSWSHFETCFDFWYFKREPHFAIHVFILYVFPTFQLWFWQLI